MTVAATATATAASRPPAAARAGAAELDYRPSYLAAGIAGLVVFLLYLVTLAPTTSMWDTSEYIAAAYVLGIPHPPGNPFFVLIGRVFAILPIAPTVAMRINVLAALSSAVSAGLWFLITERADAVVRGMVDNRSNAFVEAMNGLLQQAKRAARGFRTSTNFIAIAYLRMSKLKHLPAHPFAPPRPAQ